MVDFYLKFFIPERIIEIIQNWEIEIMNNKIIKINERIAKIYE